MAYAAEYGMQGPSSMHLVRLRQEDPFQTLCSLALSDGPGEYFLALRVAPVVKLIRVGLAGACIQAIVVAAVAMLPVAAMRVGQAGPDGGSPDFAIETYVPVLRLAYLLLASGLVLTHSRWLDVAAQDVRRASREANPFSPGRMIRSIFSQLMIVTICFAIAVLRPPPHLLRTLLGMPDGEWVVSAIWSGTMSVVMVAFGISALAAHKAMRQPHASGR